MRPGSGPEPCRHIAERAAVPGFARRHYREGPAVSTVHSFAFLADGQLFVVRPPERPQAVESPFVLAAEDRRASERDRHGWRTEGMMWNFRESMAPGLRMMPTGPGVRPVRFTGVAAAAETGALYYALVNEAVGGLFHYTIDENYERRLAHRRGLELRDLARCPVTGRLACSLRQPDAAANLALMEPDGGKLRDITSGDSVDEAPSWALDRPGTLVFQSAGIARNEAGMALGLGPYALCALDLERDQFETLLEADAFDHLLPHRATDGTLHYIRRRYEFRPGLSPVKLAGDILFFPFRVARSFVHFLDAFSMFFSKKPLLTAGGPRKEGPDRRAMMLWGRWVEIERFQRSRRPDDSRPLVPRDWQLIRRSPSGEEATLAESVLAYDVTPAGEILYTNGRGVFVVDRGGKRTRLASGHLIERVVAMA